MEIMVFSIRGIVSILMLIGGIALTVITMLGMRSGRITLPTWGKVLLCGAMIAMLAIQIFAILPPEVVHMDNPFEEEYIHIVTPSTPESVEAAP